MEWYQILMIVFLTIYLLGSLLADSCFGMIGRWIWFGLIVWALNAGNFFA